MSLDRPRVRRVRFFKTATGNPVAREEFYALSEEGQAALGELMMRFEHDLQRPAEIGSLGKGLFELRTQVGNNPYRALFFYDGPKYSIVVTCFYKNQQKTPKSDIKVARDRMAKWKAAGRVG